MEIIKLRALYPEMEEATIGRWTAKEGDIINYGDTVAEFITDKVAFDYTAEFEGKIVKILIADKSVVPVNINLLIVSDEPIDENIINELKAENEKLLKEREEAISGFFAATGLSLSSNDNAKDSANMKKQVRATPSARRLAKELNINLENINGTGNNGMITEEDIKAQS